MASLNDFLPAPTDGLSVVEDAPPEQIKAVAVVPAPSTPAAGVSRVVALKSTGTSDPDYAAIVRQGENATRMMHTNHDAMVEKPRSEALHAAPSAADVAETTRQTKAALEGVLSARVHASGGARKEKPKFVRYTPANASGATSQRIIKMVQAPRDPMEPPRFAQRKAPVNPPSPPAPVMHSPERKATREEEAEWKIPPVVSDWKNNRGYTISLDKRLAADGRALVDRSINDRFATMAEALYQAEKTARADVEKRAALQRQVSVRAKAARERELRQLAERARRERRQYLGLSERTDTESVAGGHGDDDTASIAPSVAGGGGGDRGDFGIRVDDVPPPCMPRAQGESEQPVKQRRRPSRFGNRAGPKAVSETTDAAVDEDEAAARRRDAIRRERRAERERELRSRDARGAEDGGATLKRSKLTRDLDRDVSEQAALGQAVLGTGGGEVMYDERLFNQDGGNLRRRGGAGYAGGYGADDAYNLYEEPLFKGSSMPARNLHVTTGRSGRLDKTDAAAQTRAADAATEAAPRAPRDDTVEFEHDISAGTGEGDAGGDPYGLNKLVDGAGHADVTR